MLRLRKLVLLPFRSSASCFDEDIIILCSEIVCRCSCLYFMVIVYINIVLLLGLLLRKNGKRSLELIFSLSLSLLC
jgi:hypothetical protein